MNEQTVRVTKSRDFKKVSAKSTKYNRKVRQEKSNDDRIHSIKKELTKVLEENLTLQKENNDLKCDLEALKYSKIEQDREIEILKKHIDLEKCKRNEIIQAHQAILLNGQKIAEDNEKQNHNFQSQLSEIIGKLDKLSCSVNKNFENSCQLEYSNSQKLSELENSLQENLLEQNRTKLLLKRNDEKSETKLQVKILKLEKSHNLIKLEMQRLRSKLKKMNTNNTRADSSKNDTMTEMIARYDANLTSVNSFFRAFVPQLKAIKSRVETIVHENNKCKDITKEQLVEKIIVLNQQVVDQKCLNETEIDCLNGKISTENLKD